MAKLETLKQIEKRKKAKLAKAAEVGRRARIRHGVAHFAKLIRRKKSRNRERLTEVALVERYLAEAKRLSKLLEPYVWGGSHGSSPTPPNGPFDCSSYASHLDQTVVQDVETTTTFSMETNAKAGAHGLEMGEGQFITHHICNSPASDAHVITSIRIHGKLWWTECGGSDNTERGGPCFFNPSAARIAHFPIKCHPKGL